VGYSEGAALGALVIADAHEGLKAAVAKVLKAIRQRCRVHYADLWIMPSRCRDEAVTALVRSA
jgi:putative transposase